MQLLQSRCGRSDPAIYTEAPSIFTMLSDFWAHFIRHERMIRCRGKHFPYLCFADFHPRGVALHRLPCGPSGRRDWCRLACAHSSGYTRPGCLDERTSRGGEYCQSRSDCSLSLALSISLSLSLSLFLSVLLSDQIQPPTDKLLQAYQT